LEPLARAPAEEDLAVAATLAEDGDLVGDAQSVARDGPVVELEPLAIEPDELGDAAAGRRKELEERPVADAVVGRGVEALDEPLELLRVQVPRVGARVGSLRELDLLGRGNGKIDEHAELEQPTERDEMEVLARRGDRALADVGSGEKPPAGEVARVRLQDPDVDVADPRCRAVATDEVEELDEEALVPRKRRLAPAFVAELLQERPCEVTYRAVWPELPRIEVGARQQTRLARSPCSMWCNLHSARCLQWVRPMCQGRGAAPLGRDPGSQRT